MLASTGDSVLSGLGVESLSALSAADTLYASLDTKILEDSVAGKNPKDSNGILQEKQRKAAHSARLGKRLDPDLKSWLDNVIIPALVREYLAEIKQQNRLASTGPSEVTSDKGR